MFSQCNSNKTTQLKKMKWFLKSLNFFFKHGPHDWWNLLKPSTSLDRCGNKWEAHKLLSTVPDTYSDSLEKITNYPCIHQKPGVILLLWVFKSSCHTFVLHPLQNISKNSLVWARVGALSEESGKTQACGRKLWWVVCRALSLRLTLQCGFAVPIEPLVC